MKRSDELKQEINAKREEVENLRREGKIASAKNAAKELTALVDELELELAKEKSDFENFLKNGKPLNGVVSGQKGGVAGEDYRQNFFNAVRKRFENNSSNYLRESTLPDGGYLVPTNFHNEIVSALEQENVLRQMGTVIATESTHRVPVVSTKPAASWVTEGEDIVLTNEKFSQVILDAFKLATGIKVSNELLFDSFYPIEDHITSEFSKAFARNEEEFFLTGNPDPTAPKTPTGILTTLAKQTTPLLTQGTEISCDDLISLQYSLERPYRKKACWLMSDKTLAVIRRLKNAMQDYIWQPSLIAEEPPMLLGNPVYTSNFMPEISSGNLVVMYGNFKDYYLIAERGPRIFKPLRELYAGSDQTGFMMIERIDAKLTNLDAVKVLKVR